MAEVQGQTVVVVTHDPRIAAGALRVMNMADGKIAESGNVLTTDRLDAAMR